MSRCRPLSTQDKFDLSQFEPALLKYFTVENIQYGMPFNNSNPLLYYNKTMFKDAGLNPDQAPRTWDDIAQAATKLTKKDASGKVTQPGIVIAIYSWFFEQWHATQNAVLATPDNGRSARATKLVYNAEAGTKIMDWWKGMIDQGICGNLGRNSSDTQKAFIAGQIPMTLDSTAALRGVVARRRYEVRCRHRLHAPPRRERGRWRCHHRWRGELHRQG